jgi:DNA-binding MarR family transcriptional regulator
MAKLRQTDIKALEYLAEHGETKGTEISKMFNKRFQHPKGYVRMLEQGGYVDTKSNENGETVLYITELGKKKVAVPIIKV